VESGLIKHALKDDIALAILAVSKIDEDDVTNDRKKPLLHIATNVAEAFDAFDAHGLTMTLLSMSIPNSCPFSLNTNPEEVKLFEQFLLQSPTTR